VAVLLGSSLVLSAPSWAATGGASLPSGGSSLGGAPTTGASSSGRSGSGPSVNSGDVTVTATAGGLTISSRISALLRKQLRIQGQAPQSAAGSTVEIERLGRQTHWAWAPTVSTVVSPDGTFTALWRANHIGPFSIRAVLTSAGSHIASDSAPAAPTVGVTVYRPSLATEFGPGFYGQSTACGTKLRRNTIGLANRTLKCGTPVAIYFRGRTMIVPVIDRGPYANGADWDLTEATGRALGMDGTATIGAVSEPKR
jgi:peptidoglycan lytic transglycosylase